MWKPLQPSCKPWQRHAHISSLNTVVTSTSADIWELDDWHETSVGPEQLYFQRGSPWLAKQLPRQVSQREVWQVASCRPLLTSASFHPFPPLHFLLSRMLLTLFVSFENFIFALPLLLSSLGFVYFCACNGLGSGLSGSLQRH
jgi:hypothetical protein